MVSINSLFKKSKGGLVFKSLIVISDSKSITQLSTLDFVYNKSSFVWHRYFFTSNKRACSLLLYKGS